MKKTSIHFNEKGLVRETHDLNGNENTNIKNQFEFIEEKLKRERGNINFEPPCDFDEDTPVKDREDIRFEVPIEPTIEACLDALEKGQSRIMMMLQRLLDNN